MNELNGEDVLDVREGRGLSGGDDRGRGSGKAGGNDKAAQTSAWRGSARIPDPQVAAGANRRRFSAAYKARVVEQAQGCTEPGQIGALLRREGLYGSHLSKWRQQSRAGALHALGDDTRGRKAGKHPLEDEVARLRTAVLKEQESFPEMGVKQFRNR